MAVIKLHNTLSGEKEEFKPLTSGMVGIYSCGPTVYDRIHIGNLRAFLFPDILRRMFEFNNYKVNLIRNITDVDDKTIKRSLEEHVSLSELTQKYEALYLEDLEKMNVLSPSLSPRATDHINDMISLIERLLKKEIAYKASDGIYFSIAKSKQYGKLAGLNFDAIELKERIANDEYDKESPQDFALWKFWSEADGNNFWDVSLGKGRPGWHIECSAMSTKFLGDTFDIHTGGIDLIFPHHTNEIAQSEGASGKPLAHYWLHNGHILVDGKKMAKSAKNFYTLKDLEEKNIAPLAFRYWLLTAHYRTLVNFTLEAVQGSQEALRRLVTTLSTFDDDGAQQKEYIEKCTHFINDDLDTPRAVALIWELLKDTSISDADKKATILAFDKVLGLNLKEQIASTHFKISKEIKELLDSREKAREEKNYTKADELRKAISEAGYEIKDTDEGPRLTKL